MSRYLIIVNPAAASGRTAKLVPTMHELFADTDYELQTSASPGHSVELVTERVVPEETTVVIAVGGDGTVHEVVNGLMSFDAGVRPALGIFSGGSGNDAARGFGIPKTPAEAAVVLRAEYARGFDIGRVNDRYFAGSFSIGLDALVVAKTIEYKASKGWSGSRLYYSALLNVIATQLKPIGLDISYHDEQDAEHTLHANVLLSATTNGKTYGGGIAINPSARPDDGVLTLSWVDSLSVPATLMRLPLIVAGKHENLRVYHSDHISSARLSSSSGQPLAAQTDGELFTDTHFEVSALPDALRVIVPA